jgi:DNA-binding LacI/PurR family transcriptional regulator
VKKRATAQQVADLAGVSKWTVIRAFSEGKSITEDSRAKVLKAAEELKYSPNLLARSLATNQTNQIAVLIDDFGNPHKLPFLEALTERLQAEHKMAMLVNLGPNYDMSAALTNADQRQVDGIILLGTAISAEAVENWREQSATLPLYVLARHTQVPGVVAVDCNAEIAISEIGSYLYGRGYRKPAFMTGPRNQSFALGRFQRFTDYWRDHGVENIAAIPAHRYSLEEGAAAIRAYLSATPVEQRADVIMCENDALALGALESARFEFKLRIPEDLAIVGFDNARLAARPSYDLTTYEQPIVPMVSTLVDMICGRRPAQSTSLKGRLVVRGSA